MDAKFTLLVVDDVEDNRTILRRRFESVGFAVVEAESGEAALAALEQEPVDLVLLDIQMPGLSGVDTLKEMRASRPTAELPIIMVTASTAISDVVNARKLGANDYVTKPIDFTVALARVRGQLKGRVARSARMARAAG
jgi:DNA-binding response OmpR family regulator